MKTKNYSIQDVAAIVTAMTDRERPFLRGTIESVLADPGIAQVILCIEDKNDWLDSTLNSLLNDPRLEVLRLSLAPPGAIRNRALSYVRLPWVAYCDGDDLWCQGKTVTQRIWADETGCDFVGADHFLTNENGRICALAIARYLPMPSAWMVRSEVMRQHPWNESLYEAECGEWWCRTHGLVSRARCPKALLKYRIRSGSLSAKTSSMRRKVQIVSLASIPGLGAVIFFSTWCLWLLTRKKTYVLYKGWEQDTPELTVPSSLSDK
jgi:glycosyltransferase involved in cell wall biosynthesis